MEYIKEMDQYLAIFPHNEDIESKCDEQLERKSLKGLFLIKEDKCKTLFKKQELFYSSVSRGQPNIITNFISNFKTTDYTNLTIKLKPMTLQETNVHAYVPISEKPNHFYSANIWTIIIYLAIILVGSWYLFYKLKLIKAIKAIKGNTEETSKTGVKLPEDASF